jgi:hypothetical protein
MNSISASLLEFAVDDKEFYDAARRWYMVRNPNIKEIYLFLEVETRKEGYDGGENCYSGRKIRWTYIMYSTVR